MTRRDETDKQVAIARYAATPGPLLSLLARTHYIGGMASMVLSIPDRGRQASRHAYAL